MKKTALQKIIFELVKIIAQSDNSVSSFRRRTKEEDFQNLL